MYRNGEVRFLKQHLSQYDTEVVLFDVGANRGEWSEVVLDINPDAIIHCFEPGNFTFEKLIGKGFPSNVVCNNFALGSRSGTRKLVVYGKTSKHNSFYPQYDKEPEAYQEISVETIDDYCKQHDIAWIDYLKIDVEGGELDVLQGAESMLSARNIGVVQFEYGARYLDAGVFLKDILEWVATFGYEVYKLLPRGWLHKIRYSQQLENFRYANYVLSVSGVEHFSDSVSDRRPVNV